jgi:diguanylate cyclase (GGDEF)-like protein/putative nucleotidyltransferase with HDIG domain
MPYRARVFWSIVCLAGVSITVYGAWTWKLEEPAKFLAYLVTAVLASRLKVQLPEINGTISINFLFILVGVVELNFSETLALACVAITTQCFSPLRRRPNIEQLAFNVANVAVAVWLTYFVYHGPLTRSHQNPALLLMLAAGAYFLCNTLPVATIISLTEHKVLRKVWSECYFWSLPYYLVGGGIAAVVRLANQRVGWMPILLALPAMFLIYRSYRQYIGRLKAEKAHVKEMADLHLRTIEALALAIEAKDQNTHDHLERVRVYAVEIGKKLSLPPQELEALRAAALLHDIGKLAVPEHILSKPGKLTAEEFEKVKVHPLVGAEILECVRFPYPVVPIVRAHHERWDGAGYPYGLKGEEIPLGARILSAVDCLDALSTERQYRRALPLDEAMKCVAQDTGKAYDPQVVEVLQRHYKELEEIVRSQATDHQKLSTALKIERGAAPANGLATHPAQDPNGRGKFLSSIAAARQEAQALLELSHDLGNSLSLHETLSVLSVRLKPLVPFHSVAAFIVRENQLVPEFVTGENFQLLASLRIPFGTGLSGWVARTRKSIVNGNPAVEPGLSCNATEGTTLRSALSVPLEGLMGVVGVLTLYHSQADAYTPDHLRILHAISSKLALSLENALAFREAENFATTDYLTQLPNARSLFVHLDRELARCKRLKSSITVMVCDLDGFKKINDEFGHLEGNRILRMFARSLQGSCRDYDYVARMGGDEFVIVAPGLSSSAAKARGICLSEMARNAGLEVCGADWLSVSIGWAVSSEGDTDVETLLAEADRRMYSQKQEHYKVLGCLSPILPFSSPALNTASED